MTKTMTKTMTKNTTLFLLRHWIIACFLIAVSNQFTLVALAADQSWKQDLREAIMSADVQDIYEKSTKDFLNRFHLKKTSKLKSIGCDSRGDEIDGAYANLFIAFDYVTKTEVAVKVMDLFAFKHMTLATLAEGIVLNEIKHPGLVAGMGSYFIPHPISGEFSTAYILPLAKSDLLGAKIHKFADLNSKDIVLGLYNVLAAVDFLHSLGLVHCDIKLENILLYQDQSFKLCDFGGVRLALEENHSEDDNLYFSCKKYTCTNTYCAPELIDDKPITRYFDIWSLGVLLFNIPSEVQLYKSLKGLRARINADKKSGYLNLADQKMKGLDFSKELIEPFLVFDPKERASLKDVLQNHEFFASARENTDRQEAFKSKTTGDLSGLDQWYSDDLRFLLRTLKEDMERWMQQQEKSEAAWQGKSLSPRNLFRAAFLPFQRR